MLLTILTLLSALSISAVAIFYSIAGLAAIFAGAAVPIMIMGTVLEIGKLVTASWLYQNWKKAPFFLKFYLTISVIVLMFITSMGIFGFLSKAHVEQTAPSTLITQKIEQIDERLVRENSKVIRFTADLDRLNTGTNVRVDTLVDTEQDKLESIYARIDKEIADITAIANTNITTQKERITQAKERADRDIDKLYEARQKTWGKKKIDAEISKIRDNELAVASLAQKEILKIQNKLNNDIQVIKDKYQPSIDAIASSVASLTDQANQTTAEIDVKAEELEGKIAVVYTSIDDLNEEKFVLQSKIKEIEVEVGPIKYIAEFVYGHEADADLLEKSVRWVIIIIIFVFDPLAVLLLIAANFSIRRKFGVGLETMADNKLSGKLDDYWKERYGSMQDDLARFNDYKENENENEMPEATYELGEVDISPKEDQKSVDDYMDEIAYDLPEELQEVEDDPEYGLVTDEQTDEKKYWEDKNKEEEFKKREEDERQALEDYAQKAREEEENEEEAVTIKEENEEEAVSIKEDEITPSIIEDVRIADLTEGERWRLRPKGPGDNDDVKKKNQKPEKKK
jgi:hypothetical protein